MNSDNRLGEFLRARRELTRPEDLGFLDAGRRKVPGLRREEVAMLAGVSTDYYVRLEQGRERHPSAQVLDALASALRLEDDARTHAHKLAQPVPRRAATAGRIEKASPNLVRLLEKWAHTPALVLGRYLDVLARNSLADALYGGMTYSNNIMRLVFLDPAAREFYRDWALVSRATVAGLRAAVGADIDDPRLTSLVGELSLKSPEFRRLWARHDVRGKTHARKRFQHPLVGELTLHYESFTVNSAPNQQLLVYQAEPASPSEQALLLLGSLTADPAKQHPRERIPDPSGGDPA
jgi:transcriptional regulator with XRE-family HTH domain